MKVREGTELMTEVAANLEEIRERVSAACMRSGREVSEVELVAISKTFSVERVRDAVVAGQRVFGESRFQEAEGKVAMLPGNLDWHFIGRVQRNKIRKILPIFGVIHAVDSLKLASSIDEISGELGLFPQGFLQVNVGREESKGGFDLDELREDIDRVLRLPRLEILGLMTIPPPGEEAESSRKWFVMLRELRDELEARTGVPMPALSMGMSGDFEVAIEEGATHVRVGSSIFGNRA